LFTLDNFIFLIAGELAAYVINLCYVYLLFDSACGEAQMKA